MPETVGKAMLECPKLGAMGLLIQGYDPQPDAVRYGEELNLAHPRIGRGL